MNRLAWHWVCVLLRAIVSLLGSLTPVLLIANTVPAVIEKTKASSVVTQDKAEVTPSD